MQKQGEKQRKENAYFSIEAALIMPLVFLLIFFLIYVGFYQYDKCLLNQDAYRMLIRGSQVKFENNSGVAQKMKEEDVKWYYDKYMLCDFENKRIEVKHGTLSFSQDAVLTVPFLTLIDWTGKRTWHICVDVESGRIQPTDTIRNCRKLQNIQERGDESD